MEKMYEDNLILNIFVFGLSHGQQAFSNKILKLHTLFKAPHIRTFGKIFTPAREMMTVTTPVIRKRMAP